MLVRVRQSFQFFRQKTWYFENIFIFTLLYVMPLSGIGTERVNISQCWDHLPRSTK